MDSNSTYSTSKGVFQASEEVRLTEDAHSTMEKAHSAAPKPNLASRILFSSPGYYPVPYSPYTPEIAQLEHLQRKDTILKRRVRTFRLISRVLTLFLAIYATFSQALSLQKYLSTRHIIIGDRNAWAKDTQTWPTILLLTTSALTLLVSVVTIGAYVRGVKHANSTSATAGTLASVAEMGAHLTIWISATAACKIANNGSDLWGWTCSQEAQEIQESFNEIIDFSKYCIVQRLSWISAVLQVVLAVVTLLGYAFAYKRLKHKEEMEERGMLKEASM